MSNVAAIQGNITRGLGKGLHILKKYSPEILTTVGIAAGVGAAILGAKATLKVEPIIDDIQTGRELVVEKHRRTNDDGSNVYSDQERAKDVAYVYTTGALKLGKLYGPALTLGVSSIACVLAAHGIMRRRNAALVVAYKAIEEGFSAYRKRVVEELGPEKDRDFLFGVTQKEIEDEKGKKSVVSEVTAPGYSVYARCFDQNSPEWEKNNPDHNVFFLNCQQKYMNDKLLRTGHVFLNEVYDAIGVPRTPAGAIVGWTINGDGDGYIDFGMYDIQNEKARDFINGYEKAIFLDFNVDGVIYDKI